MYFLFDIQEDDGRLILFCHDVAHKCVQFVIDDFKHYFYVQDNGALSPDRINALCQQSDPNVKRQRYGRRAEEDVTDAVRYVLSVEPVVAEPIYGYKLGFQRRLGQYLKVTLAHPSYMCHVSRELQRTLGLAVFENKKISHRFRFLIDAGLSVGHWFSYDGVSGWRGIKYVPNESVPDLMTFTFDIECASENGTFPKPETDAVIAIGVLVKSARRTQAYMLTWRHAPLREEYMLCVDQTEKEMLASFRDLVLHEDPDVILTFNGNKFDFPYLIDRAKVLNVPQFTYISRVPHLPLKIVKDKFESKAHGASDQFLLQIPGRVVLDVHEQIRREYTNLRTYTLNACGQRFLAGETKDDLHHSLITKSWNGSDQTRDRLFRYCMRDVDLTYRLADTLKLILAVLSISRVSVVDMNTVLQAGQQIKSTICVAKFARQYGFICAFAHPVNNSQEEYEGGLVLEVEPCYITDPTKCLDFNSLYPTVIIAFNLCWTTWIPPSELHKFSPEQYYRSPTGDCFVRAEIFEGILPRMLKEGLAARNAAKKMMATGPPEMKAVYDKLQDALKKENNSRYGYTGATLTGHLPCVAVSRSTTAIGRQSLQRVIDWVKQKHPELRVVYGDTDSVFVVCPGATLQEAWDLMHKYAAQITNELFSDRPPMRLAPEKVFTDLLFVSKKRYAGYMYIGSLTDPPRFYYRGLEVVRRDWCPLVTETMSTCFDKILRQRDYTSAYEFAKQVIADVYSGRVELAKLLLSAGLSKEPEDYVNASRHTRVVEKMRKRDINTAPHVGDRVCYVMVSGSQDKRVREWSEDPLFALEHDLPLNVEYYVEKQLRKPLTRVFQSVVSPEKLHELFHGSHTLVRKVVTQKSSVATKGTLLAHVTKLSSPCMLCKAPTSNPKSVCKDCSTDSVRLLEFRQKTEQELADIEDLVGQIQRTCRTCQQIGPDEPIECMARDCPNLYTRFDREKRRTVVRNKLSAL